MMKIIIFLILSALLLNSCEAVKYRPVDAKEYPPEPEKELKKILKKEEGLDFLKMD